MTINLFSFINKWYFFFIDNLQNKNSIDIDIGTIVDTRYDQFNSNNKKPFSLNINSNNKKLNGSLLLDKAFGANNKRI